MIAVGPERLQAFRGQLLHGDGLHEVRHGEATEGACVPVGGQNVVRARAVVA